MFNIKIWAFVLFLILAFILGGGSVYGYRNGNCILCKPFKRDEDIIKKAKDKGELDQDDANILVSDLVKLGELQDDGTFELTQGNEEKYQAIFDTLGEYDYKINYQSIIAEKV